MATSQYSKVLSAFLSCFLLPFCIIGCGSGGTQSQSTAPAAPSQPTQPSQPSATADFSLSASTSSVSVTIGGSTGASISLTTVVAASAPADDEVTINASALPTGISINDIAGGGSIFPLNTNAVYANPNRPLVTALTFGVNSSATAGTYPITFTGTDTVGQTYSASLSLTVVAASALPPPPSNPTIPLPSLVDLPSSLTMINDGPADILSFAFRGTASQQVDVSISLPPGIYIPSGSGISTLSLKPNAAQYLTIQALDCGCTAGGNLQISESENGTEQTIEIPITVVPAGSAEPSFSLSIPTAPISISGTSGTFTVQATSTDYYAPIDLTLSGVPTGVTLTAQGLDPTAPVTILPGESLQFEVSVSSSAGAGTSLITLVGTSGDLTYKFPFSLTVTPPVAPPAPVYYTLSTGSSPLTLNAGSSISIPLTVSGLVAGGSSVVVTPSAGGLPTGVTISPASLSFSANGTQNFTLSASASAPSTSSAYDMAFQGTLGSDVQSVFTPVTVVAAPPVVTPPPPPPPPPPVVTPTFTFAVGSSSLTLNAGGTVSEPVTVSNLTAGSTAVVNVSGPAGISVSTVSLNFAQNGSQTVTFSTPNNALASTGIISFTGALSDGTDAQSATTSLTIVPLSIPQISVGAQNPTTCSLTVSVSNMPTNDTVTVTPGGGFIADSPSSPLVFTQNGVAQTITFGRNQSTNPNTNFYFTGVFSAQDTLGSTIQSVTIPSLTDTCIISSAPSAPQFTLTATTSGTPVSGSYSATIQAGGTGAPVSLSVIPSNGYSDTTNIAISGLPAGVTTSPASFQSLPVNLASAVTITADDTATPGDYVISFTGTDATGTATPETATLNLTVTPASPTAPVTPVLSGVPTSELLTAAGASVGFNVTLTTAQAATMTVTYPTGVTGPAGPFNLLTGQPQQITLQAPQCNDPCGAGGNLVLTVTAGAAVQTYTIPVTVTGDNPPTFTLALSQNSIGFNPQTNPPSFAVMVSPVYGFDQPVVVSFASTGASIPSFTVPANNLGIWTTVTVTSLELSGAGPWTVTVTATSSGIVQTLPLTIMRQN